MLNEEIVCWRPELDGYQGPSRSESSLTCNQPQWLSWRRSPWPLSRPRASSRGHETWSAASSAAGKSPRGSSIPSRSILRLPRRRRRSHTSSKRQRVNPTVAPGIHSLALRACIGFVPIFVAGVRYPQAHLRDRRGYAGIRRGRAWPTPPAGIRPGIERGYEEACREALSGALRAPGDDRVGRLGARRAPDMAPSEASRTLSEGRVWKRGRSNTTGRPRSP
jgi:hypothetical protein